MLRLLKNTSKTPKNTYKAKVFLGLSGGVDSAVSAALLKQDGYDVTGVFIKVWQPDFLTCTWREERRDAMRVAARLNIPFLFLDFEKEYKKGVADYMIEEYRKGRTPNPDVMCNREIKFGAFWQKAKELGADYIATGHYARNEKGVLMEGADKEKDQSYFLWTLPSKDLEHVLFPVGDLKKEMVRRLARKFNLPVSDKKDSQGICFLGDVNIEEFLSHFIDVKAGDVLDIKGNTIGRHNGSLLYTLGERHGFEITKKTPDSKALFVVKKDINKNTITVSDQKSLENSEIKIENANWISMKPSARSHQLEARIRYRQKKVSITLNDEIVKFKTPQVVASGQSIVFYNGEVVLGGAIIR